MWARIPAPKSEAWNGFWSAPIDPVYTNVVILDPAPESIVLPARGTSAAPPALSTELPWPWLEEPSKQSKWLMEVENAIKLVMLGADSCSLGVQFVVPVGDVSDLATKLTLEPKEPA